MRDEGPPLPALQRAAVQLAVANTLLTLLERLHDLYLPGEPPGLLAIDRVILAATIAKGHVEGRPFIAAKLGHFLGIPRPTVLRKVEPLIAAGVVERKVIERGRGRQKDLCYVLCETRANSDVIVTEIGGITAALRLRMLEIDAASKFDARVEFGGLTVGLPERELAG
jgi:hypothetical protein